MTSGEIGRESLRPLSRVPNDSPAKAAKQSQFKKNYYYLMKAHSGRYLLIATGDKEYIVDIQA